MQIKQRVADVMIKTVVTEESAVVDYADIEGRGEQDDWAGHAPWEECDGWEHEIDSVESFDGADLDDLRECAGYVHGRRYENPRIVSIDDDDIVNRWGCTGPSGCSKQVRAETIARVKRKALDTLVGWYNNGWYESCAIAEYGDYTDSVGGIYDEPWGDYTAELVEECRSNVADQLEADGYDVINRPDPPKQYSPVDHFRDRIRRNLNPYYKA